MRYLALATMLAVLAATVSGVAQETAPPSQPSPDTQATPAPPANEIAICMERFKTYGFPIGSAFLTALCANENRVDPTDSMAVRPPSIFEQDYLQFEFGNGNRLYEG